MKPYRPTAAEAATIRRVAEREAHKRAVTIQPGTRMNTTGAVSVNVLLISSDPDWADTDLHDFLTWRDFLAGVPMTEDGRALVDLYVYERGDGADLACNVQAEFDALGLVAVHQDGNKDRWRRPA